ncbi:MAG: glycosyltransferase family 39 protein [Candidatus Omnitrophica bacterium]|nr:glycosyltransferase family 39 protein [Candidatus Omnitrophota bacterium]
MLTKLHNMFRLISAHKILIIIVVVICVLECYGATQKSLWIDEFFSWGVVKRPIQDLFYQKTFIDWNKNSFPPLYEAIVHCFLKIVCIENDLTLRLPAILFFLLVIILVYMFTLKLSKSKKAAVIAAFLTATSPGYFHYGSMLRGYLFMATLVILSFLCIYAFVQSYNKKRHLIFLSFIYCCMVYTFYPLIIIIGIEMVALHIYVYKRKQYDIFPFLMMCILLPSIAFIPWYANFITDYYTESTKGMTSLTALQNVWSFISTVLWHNNSTLIVHGVIFPVSLFFLYKSWYKKTKKKNAGTLVVSYIVLTCTVGYIFIFIVKMMLQSYGADGFLYVRYYLPVFFVIIIYNSIFIAKLKSKILLTAFIISLTCLNVHNGIRWHINMPEMKQVASYVEKFVSNDNQTHIFFEDVMFIPGFLYYFAGSDYAFMAVQRYWGERRIVNEALRKKNIRISGNVIGLAAYRSAVVLKQDHDVLVLIGSDFFDDYAEYGFYGTDNFINSTEYYMEKEGLIYQLLGKKHFNSYTVAVYKNSHEIGHARKNT